jgi:hypothetical protein
MSALLAKIIGPLLGSPWLLLAAGLVAGGLGFAAGDAWRGRGDAPRIAEARQATAQCIAVHEKARADGAEATVTALSDAASRARAAMELLARKEAARQAATDQFRQELAHAPDTSICGTSAAERAYRRSVLGAAE